MEYSAISIYNRFINQSKKMRGKMARGVGGVIQPIGEFVVSGEGREEDGYSIFGRRFS